MLRKNLDNLKYLITILWNFDKWIFILFCGSVLTKSVIPYIGLLFPKFVLQAILNQISISQWICLFIVFGMAGTFIYIVDSCLTNLFKAHISIARNGCFGQMLSEKMMTMEYSLLESPKIQELCYRANFLFWSDHSGMAGTFENLRVLFAGIITILGLIGVLSQLSLILPVLLVLLVTINFKYLMRARTQENILRKSALRKEREKEYINSQMCDLVAGKDIRIFKMDEWFSDWFGKVSKNTEQTVKEIGNNYQKAELCEVIISIIRDAGIFFYLLSGVLNNRFLIDDFVLYLGAIANFTKLLVTIIDRFLGVRQFLDHTDDFRRVMELDETFELDESKDIGNEKFDKIVVENVCFKYPQSDIYALENVSFDIKPGEHIAIIGRNGAGKTTLIKLLLGLYAPCSGQVHIFTDKEVINKEKKCFGLFSVAMQRVFQYAFSLEENITFKPLGQCNYEKLRRAVELSGFSDDVNRLPMGLKTMLRKDIHSEAITLSGGQSQKLAIARVLYRDTPIVILDEPSSALDPIAEYEIYNKINTLLKDKTCIFISHRLSSVRFCNRMILMDNGQIIADGSHEQLIETNSLYAELWNAQSKPYQ